MTGLLDILKEQSAFGFTGKINLLLVSNGQFQGVIYQHEGLVVGASYGQMKSQKALYKMVFDDVESVEQFKFIVEPELISSDLFTMKLSFEQIKSEAQSFYQKYVQSKKLKPSPELRLVIDPEIIVNTEELTPSEFEVMAILTEWSKVADIYKYSKLMEYEVTSALVGLRKKRAIKVFQN